MPVPSNHCLMKTECKILLMANLHDLGDIPAMEIFVSNLS